MDNKISVLDFKVANLIAAGEVVERPASAIKELVENSIDSGAKNITVEIQNGGISVMRVTDDGCGMSRQDAAICLKRHATSKIKEEADLNYIVTLGFRGEALAAISSVSRMRIFTKRRQDEMGTLVECDGGGEVTVDEIGCADGTTVIAEELFANVPARRKFLKKDAAETMAVTSAVEKAALAHPELSFKLICDGKIRYQTAGDGNLRNTVYALMGRDYATKLIAVRGESESIGISGYIGSPELVKKNRGGENFFINGRYIKSATASAAIEAAFQTYIPSEKFPVCILHVKLHPSLVDVNVHPSKLEVKFSNERAVFDAIYSAVRGALVHSIERPSYDFHPMREGGTQSINKIVSAFVPEPDRTEPEQKVKRSLLDIDYDEPQKSGGGAYAAPARQEYVYRDEDAPVVEEKRYPQEQETIAPILSEQPKKDIPAADFGVLSEPGSAPSATASDTYNSVSSEPAADISALKQTTLPVIGEQAVHVAFGYESLPLGGGDAVTESAPSVDSSTDKASEEIKKYPVPEYRMIGVAANAYVFVELEDCVMVIDKHAAHERILFEQMRENMLRGDSCPQILLLPETLKLSGEELASAIEYRDEIVGTGFDYSIDEDSRSVTITQVPSGIESGAATDMFTEILTRLQESGTGAELSRDSIYEKALFQASCKAAVKAGRDDDISHVKWICDQVMSNPRVRYCPHGRPVAFDMTKHDIEKRFKRI